MNPDLETPTANATQTLAPRERGSSLMVYTGTIGRIEPTDEASRSYDVLFGGTKRNYYPAEEDPCPHDAPVWFRGVHGGGGTVGGLIQVGSIGTTTVRKARGFDFVISGSGEVRLPGQPGDRATAAAGETRTRAAEYLHEYLDARLEGRAYQPVRVGSLHPLRVRVQGVVGDKPELPPCKRVGIEIGPSPWNFPGGGVLRGVASELAAWSGWPAADFQHRLNLLQRQAKAGQEFGAEVAEPVRRWVAQNPHEALRSVLQESWHGRIRWLLLEALAAEPSDLVRGSLVHLLRIPDLDPWLLNGVPTVIREVPMQGYREETRVALKEWLERAKSEPERFADVVTNCALGELLLTFGSFAEPGDIALLGSFVLGPWPLKPRVNACDALARTTRRHCQSREVEDFFKVRAKSLQNLGRSLQETRHLSSSNGALLFGWLELMVARLGEEGQMAVDLAYPDSTLALRADKAIQDAAKVLRRRGSPPEWLKQAIPRAELWRKQLLSQHL